MKTQIVGWIGGAISAVVAAGPPALLSVALLGVLMLTASCWVIIDRSRTVNLVAIIDALQRHTRSAPEPDQERDIARTPGRR